MKNLRELVTIVNRVKIRDVSVVGRGRNWAGQKIKTLYEGIAQGKFQTDEDAALAIYGEGYSKTSYTSLKKHLTDRLLNTIFFIKLGDTKTNDFQKEYFDIYKLNAVIKILAGKGAKTLAITLAERLIIKSLKYQFTEVSLDLGKLLRRHFKTHKINGTKAAKYDTIVKSQMKIFLAETKVEDYYEQLIFSLRNKRSSPNELVIQGKEIAENVRKIFPRIDSSKLGVFANQILVIEHELSRDFKAIEKACKKAIKYYEEKGQFDSEERALLFHTRLLAAYIPLQKFKEGEEIVAKILASISLGSINWFLTLEQYFLLSMHTENYTKAEAVLQLATKNGKFKGLGGLYKEMWLIYEAYVEYLKYAGILEKADQKNFRVARFMNQVPTFSKDKKGINISILIIQALLLIAQDKEAKVIDKVEALKTYVYTYLRNDESLRSNVFIKMLLKMVQSHFHKNGTIRRTEDLRKKLRESPIGTKGYSQYVEIIPYEKLWDVSLGFLSNRAF